MPWTDPEGQSIDAQFGTTDGYQEMLGVTLADDQAAQVAQQIQAAAQYVQRVTGQELVVNEDEEVTFDGPGTRVLFLPQLPVTDVSAVSVVENGGTTALVEGTDYEWSARRGAIRRLGAHWPRAYQSVIVTYSHGYETLPLDVQRLIYSLAARGVGTPDGQAVTQEQIGQYSATYEGMRGGLTAWESNVLSLLRDRNGVAV
jgi:hypothetical protein